MPLPVVLYVLGWALVGGLVGGAIGVTLAVFFDDIKNWIQSSFNYVVTEAKVVIDRIYVNWKRVIRIRATTQRRETIQDTMEEVNIENLPPEIREKIEAGKEYRETLLLTH